jgi:hypothetical protein
VRRSADSRGIGQAAGARNRHHRSAGAARARSRTIWPRPHPGTGALGRYPLTNADCSPAVDGSGQGRHRRRVRRYIARHKAELPEETIGVGDAFDFQLFDRALLTSADTRFVLAGIVNRMDRTLSREEAAARSA